MQANVMLSLVRKGSLSGLAGSGVPTHPRYLAGVPTRPSCATSNARTTARVGSLRSPNFECCPRGLGTLEVFQAFWRLISE